MDAKTRRRARIRRHVRVRRKISGTAERPRLAVYRSNRHIYAQLVDDEAARTLVAASDREVRVGGTGKAGGDGKTAPSKAVGELLAERAKAAGIERVVFDRGGRLFHGRVAALAEGAREKGLQI
jgi:large subunit ribosomal protein L18